MDFWASKNPGPPPTHQRLLHVARLLHPIGARRPDLVEVNMNHLRAQTFNFFLHPCSLRAGMGCFLFVFFVSQKNLFGLGEIVVVVVEVGLSNEDVIFCENQNVVSRSQNGHKELPGR